MSAEWAGASYGIQTEEERKLGVNVEKVGREKERRKLSRGQKCMKKLRKEKHSSYVLW